MVEFNVALERRKTSIGSLGRISASFNVNARQNPLSLINELVSSVDGKKKDRWKNTNLNLKITKNFGPSLKQRQPTSQGTLEGGVKTDM